MVNCSGCPCYFDLLVTVSIMNIYFWLICFTSWVLQWLSNLERIIGSSLNWRKRVKPGLRQQRLMKMEKRFNPHIPQYMSSAPWYLNAERPVSFTHIQFNTTLLTHIKALFSSNIFYLFLCQSLKHQRNGNRIQIIQNPGMIEVQKYFRQICTGREHVKSKWTLLVLFPSSCWLH